jgi:hypothetical protein
MIEAMEVNARATFWGVAVSGLVLLASAAPAFGGTVRVAGGGQPEFVAGSDESNHVRAGKSAGVFTVSDSVPMIAGPGCAPVSATSAECPSPAARITIRLGDGSDSMSITGGTAVSGSGGTGSDLMSGRGMADELAGGPGRDGVNGQGGNDVLLAADGDDVLLGEAGDDALNGGNGADDIRGGSGTDTATYAGYGSSQGVTVTLDDAANDGNATVDAGRTDNVRSDVENLIGGNGDDVLNGSAKANSLTGRDGADIVNGRDGDDLLNGGTGSDLLAGGSGMDVSTYAARTGAVTVTLDDIANDGDADDESADNVRTEKVITGSGDDTITGNGDFNELDSGSGEDSVEGGPSSDTIDGGPGNDTLYGEDGEDTVDGGPGNDFLGSGRNYDVLNGGEGNDTLADSGYMGTGQAMDGGPGNDTLIPGDGIDDVDGGDGFDTANYQSHNYTEGTEPGPDGVVITLDNVANDGNRFDCTYFGSSECGAGTLDNVRTTIERVIGTTEEGDGDTLVGDDNANMLVGSYGPDILRGMGGDDDLDANDGQVDQEIDCGAGSADVAHVDGFDPAPIGASCETVEP